MDKILESVKSFLATGNNLTVVIVLLAMFLILLIAIIVTSIKKRNVEKKVAEEEATISQEEMNESLQRFEEATAMSPALEENDTNSVGAILVNNETDSLLADETVIMTPVREKARPVRKRRGEKPEPQERVSSFGEPNPSPDDGKYPGSIHIYEDTKHQYRFRIRSSNNYTLAHSYEYTSKAGCKSGIKTLIKASNMASIEEVESEDYLTMIGKPVFEIYKDKQNKYRFRLKSANAVTIIASQGYTFKENCFKGIESIRRIAEFHKIIED